jgi:hypothetical protein
MLNKKMTSIQDRIEQKTIEVSSGVKDRYILLQWVGNHHARAGDSSTV